MPNDKFIKISIISVVFNAKSTVNETILSILRQTYRHLEYIIIDGGSDDGTVDIIKQYRQKVSFWCTKKDNGIYDAMNNGLNHATGDFVIFINSGDILYSPNTISDVVDKITDINSVYYGNAMYVNKASKNTTWRGGPFSKYRLSKTNICHQTIFYPKIIYDNHRYNLKYKLFADWVYNMQIHSLTRFKYIDLNISYYDDMGVSAVNNDYIFKKEQFALIVRYLGLDCLIYLAYNKFKIVISRVSRAVFDYYIAG